MLRANPDQMAMLKQNNPKLSEALESGDLEAFAKVSIQITQQLVLELKPNICAGVERTTGCEEGEGENENQVAFFKAFPLPIPFLMKLNFSG